MDTITISKKEYFNLRKDSIKLNMLESAGVDNWDWYSDAFYPDGDNDINYYIDELKKEIGVE